MQTARLSCGIAAVALIAVTSLHSTGATAGDMSLTIAGFSAPIEILTFSTGASQASAGTGGGGGSGKAIFAGITFVAPESTASPTEWLNLASGQHMNSAVLQVLSPASGQLVSAWAFTNVIFRNTYIGIAGSSGGSAGVTFTLEFGAMSYRVYAADGSIAETGCLIVVAGSPCPS